MNIDYQGGEGHLEKLDADAVCIQCGTVNAEGTLLCKVCGNNLRDQRNRRLASDQILDSGQAGPKFRIWLSPVLFIIAVTAILSTLYNQDMIINWMMGIQSGDHASSSDLWRGHFDDTFAPLLKDLEDNLPIEEDALAARSAPAASPTLDGVYALFSDDIFVGSANVRVDETGLYFVALLESGEQVRGHGTLQGNYYMMVPELGGIKERTRINPVQGVASPQGDGVVECVGEDTRSRFSCMAYRFGT